MIRKPKVLVLRAAGTNCNEETAFAFSYFGADVHQVHIKALTSKEVTLKDFHILALPGGFSYGDDIASGRILANELRMNLGDDLRVFLKAGKLMIGICNGFQILVKAGILPGLGTGKGQEATLFHNDSAKFEARWTHLNVLESPCVWTKGLSSRMYLPVAHGEGKFIPKNQAVLNALKKNGQIVFKYCAPGGGSPEYPQNPNGSTEDIAGICDPTGRILGLMPHPERHFFFEHHPSWTRLRRPSVISNNAVFPAKAGIHFQDLGEGAKIFENGILFVKKNLL